MTKFVINKIIIEKSDKDIPTGRPYNLTDGFNIICGNNEAGKSSLMKFIKEVFFKPSKSDAGKIFFSVDKELFRADIKNTTKKSENFKLYDNNNNIIEYEVIKKFIDQKYFEQGFTINIEDLMGVKNENNNYLINTIKDPSSNKLGTILSPETSLINECIGERGKPKKPVSSITSKISDLNKNISELSNKEADYISTISMIKECCDELDDLNKKEDLINLLIEKRNNEKKINELNSQIKEKSSLFNAKVYDAREEYAKLAQYTGKYESNNGIISRLNEKIDLSNNKIKELDDILKNSFGISITKEDILAFNFNYEKLKRIKALFEEINNQTSEIEAYKKTIEDINNTLLKLESDYKFIENRNKSLSYKEISNLCSSIDNGLKQIKSLEYETNENEEKKNKNNIRLEKVIFYILSFLSIGLSALFFLQNKNLLAILFLLIFGILIYTIYNLAKKSLTAEKNERILFLKNNILNGLREKIKPYYPEISDAEGFFAITKFEEIKQELKNTIDRLEQNSNDTEFNKAKIQDINNKIEQLEQKIKLSEKTISDLIENNITTDGKIYVEAINIIKDLKEEILDKSNSEKELEETKQANISINEYFNSFINENKINIPLSSDLNKNFQKLAEYIEDNNKIKKEIDILQSVIDNIKDSEKYNTNSKDFQELSEFSNLEILLTEIQDKKKTLEERKHVLNVQKSRLEEVESIVNIKNERNLAINELRHLTEQLIIARSVINLVNIAKNNFDKTQPDLIKAQRYLSLLTNGKYSKINIDLQEITNEEQTLTKRWNELSRGTKEQLYLALRLGYASNYSIKDKNKPDLPLIIDDAFVNFDPQRMQNALNCLVEFSNTNQVIFFTCHSDLIKENLTKIGYIENTNIINL